MPWKTQKTDGRFQVVNDATGKVCGTHDTEAAAQAHLDALCGKGAAAPRADSARGVRRFDRLERLDGPKLTPEGWLRADAYIARTGIQIYRRADGTSRRELRRADQVFDPAALASFSMAPVTDDHPPEGLLDADNTKKYQRGHLGESVRRDGERVAAPVLITDADLVQKVLGGKDQLSGGYVCDLDETPGIFEGEHYDAEQVAIRGNHVAVVSVGRAGPDVRLRVDSADAVSIRAEHGEDPADNGHTNEDRHMSVKIKIDGVDVEFANEQGAQIVEKALKAANEKVEEASKATTVAKADAAAAREEASKAATAHKAESDGLKARADNADAKVKDLEKARNDAAAGLGAMVKQRVNLEATARRFLGEDAKLDTMDDMGIRKAVVEKVRPTLKAKLDTASADYVQSAFDVIVEDAELNAGRKGLAAARAAAGDPPPRQDAAEPPRDAEEIRADSARKSEDAWKKPTVGATLN